VSKLNTADADAVPLANTPLNGTFGAIFSTALGEFPFTAALSILSNKGYARVMAEPTLVALSGKSASFLAGGEFPIPLPQSLGTIGVEYKKFGIQLDFVPTVIGDDIQVNMGVTVSDIDFSLGVKLATVTVPGLTTRHADTTVRLKDGQSFVIAGLLSDKVRSSVDKVPWLGDVPILGTLFRSSSYRREETELLVVVTAHRVRPLDERPELPGEHDTVDPSDLELFLLGRHESLAGDGDDRGRRARRSARVPVGAIGFKR
jgi:pilus assembly protein CpaC